MNASAKRKEQLPENLFKNPAACLSTFDKQNSVLAQAGRLRYICDTNSGYPCRIQVYV